MTSAEAWSSDATTEAAPVEGAGARAEKIATSTMRPLVSATILAATSTWASEVVEFELESADVESEFVLGGRGAAVDRAGETGVLEGLRSAGRGTAT